jgi:DNA-binding beta-propeller fold protein YncE
VQRAILIVLALSLGCGARAEKPAADSSALVPVQVIPLTGVEGRIDHFALDAKGQRLFMAALGNNTVEVIDLSAGKVVQHIKALSTPQGIAFAPDANRLAIANDKDGSCRLYDGTSLEQVASVDLKDDADNVRYDPATKLFWVGYGGGDGVAGGLAAIDAGSGKQVANVPLEAHPESFQLEREGKRIYVNVPGAGHVAVVDRVKAAVVAKWPLGKLAAANFPMALDEKGRRVLVGCRRPAKLLVLNADDGAAVASVDVVGDTDDLFYDVESKRIYISGGEGRVTVVGQTDGDHYAVLGEVATAPGARTSYFVLDSRRLYVAVPHRGEQKAELRVFEAAAPAK